ncbi:MAG: hypothetical protein K8W52_03845 [Deltaproteobacteria bacterium]|nr:hypothetical protein [Deltaproteobacteria bacterium]
MTEAAPDRRWRGLARVRAHLAGRGEWWWVPLVMMVAVAWIYRDLWHQHGRATGFGWDVIDEYGPDLDFLSRDLAHGRLSAWNPFDHGGYSLLADAQVPRYYPVHWLFVGWGAAFGTGFWLIQLEVLIHHAIGGALVHLYLRTRGLGRLPALIGGLTLVSSTPFLLHKASLILWPLVWVPLVLIAIDQLLARPDWRRGVWLGAAVGLVGVAGSPPGFFYAALVFGPYALFALTIEVLAARREGRLRSSLRAIGIATGTAMGIALAICAIVFVPFAEGVPLAIRADQRGAGFALDGGLPGPATWAGMISAVSGKMEAYVGILALGFAAIAIAARPRHDRGAAWYWWAIGLVGLLLAFGGGSPLLPWLVKHVPGFGLFRVPGRYKLITAIATAIAAGYGAAAIIEVPRAFGPARWRSLAVAIVIVALSLWVAIHREPFGMPGGPRPESWAVGFALLTATLVAAGLFTRGRWRAAPLAIAALAIVHDAPLFFHTPQSPPAAEGRRLHPDDDRVLAQLGVTDAWRVHDEFVLGESIGDRAGVRDFRGYPAVQALGQKRHADILERAKRDPQILEAYNVRWLLHRAHFRYGMDACFVKRVPPEHFARRSGDIYEALHPAPLAAWYGAVRVADTAHALDLVVAAEDPTGVRRYATLEPDDAAQLDPALRDAMLATTTTPVAATLDSYAPDAIDLTIDAPAPGLVVLNESAYPGWEVSVDDDDATALRADYLLRAVIVPAGRHAIAWRFHPTHARPLFALYLLALLTVIASLRQGAAGRAGIGAIGGGTSGGGGANPSSSGPTATPTGPDSPSA